MASPLYTSRKYVEYLFRASGPWLLHSPFVYGLHRKVLLPSQKFRFNDIEATRNVQKSSVEGLDLFDFKHGTDHRTMLGKEAASSPCRPKFAALLYHLARYLHVDRVLETGTSLGYTLGYLARGCQEARSIEGIDTVAQIAKKNLQTWNIPNAEIVHGRLSEVLIDQLKGFAPQLVFLDADHRGVSIEHTLAVLKETDVRCIVVHDIYWSADMTNCWQKICADSNYPLTVDIFQAGLIFPKLNMEKQHFILRF